MPNKRSTPPVEIICSECKTGFSVPSYFAAKRITCSKTCQYKRRARMMTGASNPQANRINGLCESCGKTVEQPASQWKLSRRHFCNLTCKGAWASLNRVGEANSSYSSVPVACFHCGKEVLKIASKRKRNKENFCSHECYSTSRAERFSGPDSASWRGGYKRYYGPNWRTQKRLARARDSHTCQRCGVTEKLLGKKLDVHHLKPFRMFGYIPEVNENYLEANTLDNLICFCHLCHLKV